MSDDDKAGGTQVVGIATEDSRPLNDGSGLHEVELELGAPVPSNRGFTLRPIPTGAYEIGQCVACGQPVVWNSQDGFIQRDRHIAASMDGRVIIVSCVDA